MGENSTIAWTDHTFNAWIGCTKVSPACKHCYAEVNTFTRASRARGLELWGVDAARHVTSESTWRDPRRWDREARAAGVRRKVFCASLSDVFESRDDLAPTRARLWKLIAETSSLDWLLLTKRPEHAERLWREAQHAACETDDPWGGAWRLNVWLGTTVEDQEHADLRIPALLAFPGPAKRFISAEPLLGPVDISPYLTGESRLDWVIVGGESGPKARPFDVAWARSIVSQCRAAKIPVLVKQLGAHVVWNGISGPGEHWPAGIRSEEREGRTGLDAAWRVRLADRMGGDMEQFPEDLRIREFPSTPTW